jgi:hypothetical protein
MIVNDLKTIDLERKERQQQRQTALEINAYRCLYQTAEQTREWDLNDPNRWKSQLPVRMTDVDDRLGPSSCQIFAGEDLQASIRKQQQQEQMRMYFTSQVIEDIFFSINEIISSSFRQ